MKELISIDMEIIKISMTVTGFATFVLIFVKNLCKASEKNNTFRTILDDVGETIAGGFYGYYYPITVPLWMGYRWLTAPTKSNLSE